MASTDSNINRFYLKNFDLAVGDWVCVPVVRTQHTLDFEKGLGWVANNVIVQVKVINDLTFCFEFNGEYHYELKDEVKKTKQRPSLFAESEKIRYAKRSFSY